MVGGLRGLIEKVAGATGLGEKLERAVDAIFTSDEEKAEFARQIRIIELEEMKVQAQRESDQLTAITASDKNQAEINLAGVNKGFTWRDGVGWVCVINLACHAAVIIMSVWMPIPMVTRDLLTENDAIFIPLLGGILGLGAMRTVEKFGAIKNGSKGL